MIQIELLEKSIKKDNKTMCEILHKVLKNYLDVHLNLNFNQTRQISQLYENTINEDNIQKHYFLPIKVFTYKLITNSL